MIKKYAFTIIWICSGISVLNAQTTADDWTKTDCQGNAHSLYADYLDNSKVVVMEFGMGCSTCGIAGQYFTQLRNTYDVSHPGEVKFFYMDYWIGNDCASDIQPLVATYSLNFHAEFDSCDHEKDYYYPSSSPMPAYIICAGPFHAVYLNKNYFSNNDTALIRATIDQALADMANVNINETVVGDGEVRLYPNPAMDVLNIEFNTPFPGLVRLEWFDVSGRGIKTDQINTGGEGNRNFVVSILDLPSGSYYLRICGPDNEIIRKIEIIK